ncbi:MAG: DUF1499 domain-containing protein [Gammaproteobacteria bacterium]|nr:DUF1499 domain-containing protein [Gammaproteobacteria bacterium]
METLLIVAASITLVVVIALVVLGYRSHRTGVYGLVEGRLKPCPAAPNCVCSEPGADVYHSVEPLTFAAEDAAQVLPRLKAVIRDMGGNIEAETGDYLAATFTSSLFRFVDDLELRIDSEQNTVHLRSASRVGHSDLGANRKRVARLKTAFHSQTG